MESHLLQMRGLKQEHSLTLIRLRFVASFTDAWIETNNEKVQQKSRTGRIFYRCVD